MISKVTNQTSEEASALKSPVIMGGYAAYQAALASLRSVEAKDNYTVSIESKIQRPSAEVATTLMKVLGLSCVAHYMMAIN